jgi:ubiquinone/menaquinone biosynthesis C-methylase UbiE
MNIEYYSIKDRCRSNFNKYTWRAFESLPKMQMPNILDIGCGTGVPTLEIAQLTKGTFLAIDNDENCILWFREKIKKLGLVNQINTIHGSALRVKLDENHYDLIIAEGFFNIIGFEKGLETFSKYLHSPGYFMIHDDCRDMEMKRILFKKYQLRLLEFFILDEEVWWNEYYSCLEKEIYRFGREHDNSKKSKKLFARELSEINWYKKDPSSFRSAYYVLQKDN